MLRVFFWMTNVDPALLSSVTVLAQATVANRTTAALPIDPLPSAAIALLFVVNIITLGYIFGGLLLTSLCELRSKRQPALFILAKAINTSVLNFHPLVLILVIAPLAISNLFYFLYLFSIDSPTLGTWGMMLPPACLWLMLACMHRYTWPKRGGYDASHAYTGAAATVIALALPLVYLLWASPSAEPAASFGAALMHALPRWFHLILMSLAATSLLLAWHLGSANGPMAWVGSGLLLQVRRQLLRISLVSLVFQFAIAPLVLMTMHFEFMSLAMSGFLGLGMVACVITMVMISADMNAAGNRVGRFLPQATSMLLVAVLAMAMTRHAYQANASAPGAAAALLNATNNLEPDDSPAVRAMPGRQLFITHCNVCHASQTLAPSLGEIESIYRGDPEALARWAKQPGRKRAKYGPMPPMGHVRQRSLKLIAEYMLASGKPDIDASADANTTGVFTDGSATDTVKTPSGE